MKEYRFVTDVTMKEYNREKWWIDKSVINNGKEVVVSAETLNSAIEIFAEICATKYGIEISKNALKNKRDMFRATEHGQEQVGYCITGSTLFDTGRGWSEQFIELWCEISLIQKIDFSKE